MELIVYKLLSLVIATVAVAILIGISSAIVGHGCPRVVETRHLF